MAVKGTTMTVKRVGNGIGIALVAVGLWYAGSLGWGKLALGGGSPRPALVGEISLPEQRGTAQFCNGVVTTASDTLLVGRTEYPSSDPALTADLVDLASLLPVVEGEESYGSTERDVTLISRLDEQGQFQPVARFTGIGCLRASADGRLLLLTNLPRADIPPLDPNLDREAVFVSTDGGRSWQLQQQWALPAVDFLNSDSNPLFGPGQQLWSVTNDLNRLAVAEGSASFPLGFMVSDDGGRSARMIHYPRNLMVTAAEIKAQAGLGADWIEAPASATDELRHLQVVDADHARFWIAQSFYFRQPGDGPIQVVGTVTQGLFSRSGGGDWQVSEVSRSDGLSLVEIASNDHGQVVAVARAGDGVALMQWQPEQQQWQGRGPLPGLFGWLPAAQGVRMLRVSAHGVVVELWADHEVPRWLTPLADRPASISADGMFYTTDWGDSWHKLDVDGYFGLLGVEVAGDRVFWSGGHSFSSNELRIHSYRLVE